MDVVAMIRPKLRSTVVSMQGACLRQQESNAFLKNGSTSAPWLFSALWPNTSRKIMQYRYSALKQFSLKRKRNVASAPYSETHVAASLMSDVKERELPKSNFPSEIFRFSAKLVIFYLFLTMTIGPSLKALIPSVRSDIYDWGADSFQHRGAIYQLLKAQADPAFAASLADYFERRNDRASAVVAWEMAAALLQERKKAITQDEVEENLERLQGKERDALNPALSR